VTFEPGASITVREVLHGQVWLEFPETVVSDEGDVLATVLVDGAPLTFVEHPWGPHPWRDFAAWKGPTVLKLRRPGDWYSVWMFFDGDTFRCWYVNFEQPVVRQHDGIDVDDLQLDLVIEPDGTSRWKDVEDLAPSLAVGRIDEEQLRHVLAAATEVSDRLASGDRWWAPWDGWVPGPPASR
jgi:hypothetical protein